MTTPVLIVCYLRPQNLDTILSEIEKSPRKTYIFLDKAPSHLGHISKEILSVVAKHQETLDITTFQMEINLGVGIAVPYAVSEVLKIERDLIVLEDDCIPNRFTLEYFDFASEHVTGKTVMVSARCAGPSGGGFLKEACATFTTYPLINGWLTNQSAWTQINPLEHDIKVKQASSWLIKNPKKIPAFCFFLAAVIRVKNGNLKAWDSFVAFKMLIGGLRSISPNRTCVTVLGVDEVASNTKIGRTTISDVYIHADLESPSHELDETSEAKLNTDRKVEKYIYQIRFRHLFSPILAIMRISRAR